MSSTRKLIVVDKTDVADATAAIKAAMGFKFKESLFTGEMQTKVTLDKATYPLCSYVLNANQKQWAAIEKALPTAEYVFIDERAKAFDGKGTRTPYRHPASKIELEKKETFKFKPKETAEISVEIVPK